MDPNGPGGSLYDMWVFAFVLYACVVCAAFLGAAARPGSRGWRPALGVLGTLGALAVVGPVAVLVAVVTRVGG
jgi:hypothetical protein